MPTRAIPRTSVAEMFWPAIPPAGLAAKLLGLQHQLAQTEWWPAARIASYQFRQLTSLLKHSFDHIPFYRKRLAAAGYQRGQAVTPQFWSQLPILGRREVQEEGTAITCAATPPGHGHLLTDATSGSTGIPLSILKTELVQLVWHAITLRETLWHRRDFKLKLGVIRRDREGQRRASQPAGRAFPSWLSPFADVFATGPGALLDSSATVAQQADWLLREEPDYLLTHPSIVKELAHFFRHNSLGLRRLKSVNTISEALSPSVRAACREVFGVGIIDIYSANELGYIALQCPLHEHYHVQSEVVLVEVLNESGQPCAPGETGMVVATPLLNYAMPLIRYAVGDLAELGGACPCGRGLEVLSQILGRTRDTVMLPSGTRRHASMGIRHLGEMREVVQFQVIQRTLYDIEVKLVTRSPLGPENEENIRQTLRKSLGEHFSVALTYHDRIARAPSGKYFDFVSQVPG